MTATKPKRLCPAGHHDLDEVGVMPASPSKKATGRHAPTCRGCHLSRQRTWRRRRRAELSALKRERRGVPLKIRDWSRVEEEYVTEYIDAGCNPSEPAWREAARTWMTEALCAEQGTELFYPPEHESPAAEAERVKAAKQICAECPVKSQCLEYALANDERIGIWGGQTPKGRSVIKGLRNRKVLAA